MKKLLFINVLMRDNSRTKELSDYALDQLKNKYEISEINLINAPISPLNHDSILKRINEGEHDPLILDFANKFKDADKIILAAPFWDMSFPSILRVFFERISLNNITFITNESGSTKGNCKADKLLYLTSRGLDINDNSDLDVGYHYLKAITTFFGIKEVIEISMTKIDLIGTDINKEIYQAKNKIDIALRNF